MEENKKNQWSGEAAVFCGTGLPLELHTYQVDDIGAGEVLIENLYTTLCGSDLHTYEGKRKEETPSVLGHEIVGRVVAFGDQHAGLDHTGAPLKVGDVVTWSIFAADPASELAKRGMPQKGDHLFKYGHARVTEGEAFHGGLARYCILRPYTAIFRIPAGLPLPIAATANCAVATVAGALRLAGNVQGRRVLITGMGLLGITCAAMCREAGAAAVLAADVSADRREKARLFGADETVDSLHPHQIIPVDVVFDMSGSPDAMEWGADMLATGGIAVWVGAVFRGRKVQLDAETIVRRLVTIRGLHNYNYEDLQYALDFLAGSFEKYPFADVVGRSYPLAKVNEAFAYALAEKPLRVGITVNE